MTPETLIFWFFVGFQCYLRDWGASLIRVQAKTQVTLPMPGRLAKHQPNQDDGEPVTLLLTRMKPAVSQLSQQQRNRHSGVLRNAARQTHCVVQHFASRLCLSTSTLPESATDVLPRNARKSSQLSQDSVSRHTTIHVLIVVFDAATW